MWVQSWLKNAVVLKFETWCVIINTIAQRRHCNVVATMFTATITITITVIIMIIIIIIVIAIIIIIIPAVVLLLLLPAVATVLTKSKHVNILLRRLAQRRNYDANLCRVWKRVPHDLLWSNRLRSLGFRAQGSRFSSGTLHCSILQESGRFGLQG